MQIFRAEEAGGNRPYGDGQDINLFNKWLKEGFPPMKSKNSVKLQAREIVI